VIRIEIRVVFPDDPSHSGDFVGEGNGGFVVADAIGEHPAAADRP
jgi:hypothetical protein